MHDTEFISERQAKSCESARRRQQSNHWSTKVDRARRRSFATTRFQYSSGCQAYAKRLEQLGLVQNQEVRDAFPYRVWVAVALLLGIAVIKIFIAMSRGRTNVLFLIILAISRFLCRHPHQLTLSNRQR
jgi:uncharacterized protein (TIGR04222 family)